MGNIKISGVDDARHMQNNTEDRPNRMIIRIIGLVSLFVLLRTAWLGDDAFITMRTVDNWVNGFGLTWNASERVQAYTHPLWMLMLTIVYFFIRDGYFALLALNIAVSLAVFFIFLRQFLREPSSMLAGWGILILSKSLVDYSTSGLENALTHLLILLFAIYFLDTNQPITPRKFLVLSLLAGLGATNRMDAILFFLPALAYLWFAEFRSLRGIGILMAGMSPFILWEIFSIIYYGFPFPNTAYAKLNSGIPQSEMFHQGILYFIDSTTFDPITLLTIGITFIVIFLHRNNREKALAAGLALYFGYVLYIGGDFMRGRFFSAGLLLSAFILAKHMAGFVPRQKIIVSGLILAAGFLSPVPTISYFLSNPNFLTESQAIIGNPYSQISDERLGYAPTTSLSAMDHLLKMPRHPWAGQGREYKANHASVVIEEGVGMIGYYAGPDVHVLDPLALGDPLLARLDVISDYWRIGHIKRGIPDGYYESLKIKKNKIEDPSLEEYYDKLKIIISGPLLSRERLITIWEMNTGKYNYLLKEYKSRQ